MVRLAAVLLVCLGTAVLAHDAAGSPPQSRLAGIKSFAVYYGTNRAFTDRLEAFDLAIVQPNTVSFRQLQALKAKGVRVVAYLSIGEAEGTMVGLPKSWILGTNPDWGSKFMDARQAGWRETVFRWAKDILDIGFDGLFLDTVDTAQQFPQTKSGMVQIIQGLRQRFPDATLVQNRGFAVLPQTAALIDAVMFEDFSTLYDFKSETYGPYEGDPSPLLPYRERGLVVLALDYALPTQKDLISRAYARARQYGFVPYVSTISLNELSPTQP